MCENIHNNSMLVSILLVAILSIQNCVANNASSGIKPTSMNGQTSLNPIGNNNDTNLKEHLQSNNNNPLIDYDNNDETSIISTPPSEQQVNDIAKEGIIQQNNNVHVVKNQKKQLKKAIKITASSALGLAAIHFILQNKHQLPSKEQIQKHAFRIATDVKEKGNIGILYFIAGIACLEMFGISSSFLEISGNYIFVYTCAFLSLKSAFNFYNIYE